MPRLVEEVLESWRAAERLLEDLSDRDPDHERVALAVDRLRALYRELTSTGDGATPSSDTSEHELARAQELLDRVESTLSRNGDSALGVPNGNRDAVET